MMRTALAVALLALAFVGCLAEDPTQKLSGVVDLTPENFDSFVNGGKHALVEFYAPWCGHCKSLVPEYKKLGEAISSDPALSSRIVIGKVDADKHRSLGERFSVRGFPSILFFGRGKPTTEQESYDQGRTLESFLSFLKGKLESDKSFARVEAMDAIAKEFVVANDKSAVVAKAEEAVAELSGDEASNGQIYVDVMKKIIAKGDGYPATEKARLERMVASGGIHQSKMEAITKKSSVLGAFVDEQ